MLLLRLSFSWPRMSTMEPTWICTSQVCMRGDYTYTHWRPLGLPPQEALSTVQQALPSHLFDPCCIWLVQAAFAARG